MKKLTGIRIFTLTALLGFLFSCHREEQVFLETPVSGDFCYQGNNGKEYLSLSINNARVQGRLIHISENQPLIRDFTGTLVTDNDTEAGSEMQITLSYADVSVDQTWHIIFGNNSLRVRYDINAKEFTSYSEIPCDSITKVFDHLQETILSYQSSGFRLPKGEPVCYEATRPAKGSYLQEFFQLWNNDGRIKGRGAGYYSGDPVWDFDFHGTMEKNTMRVTINYRKTGEEPRTVMEKWALDTKENRIYIRSYPRSVLGTSEYVQVENKDFLNFVQAYFKTEDRKR